MSFYRLKADELNTLPHWKFENKNNPSKPGRSYSHDAVQRLVYRKFGMLAGVHEQGDIEQEDIEQEDTNTDDLIRQGERLFNEE